MEDVEEVPPGMKIATGELSEPPPIPEDAVRSWNEIENKMEESDDYLPSENTDAPYECPDVVKSMLRKTIDEEVSRAVEETLKRAETSHREAIERLKDEWDRKMTESLERLKVKHSSTVEKMQEAHAAALRIASQNAALALDALQQKLELEHQNELRTVQAHEKDKYDRALSVAEERFAFQRDKEIRRMAEKCDLQVKGVRDWAAKDKEITMREMNEKWNAFVKEQQKHLEFDQTTQMTIFKNRCQAEVDEIAVQRDEALARVSMLESQLRRTYKVLEETASSRSMARITAPLSLKKYLRTNEETATVGDSNLPPPIPIASPSRVSPPYSKKKSAISSGPLDEVLLSELGYSEPSALLDTTLLDTQNALVTPGTFFKTGKPRYL